MHVVHVCKDRYLVSNLNFPESQTVLIDGRREVLDAIGHQCEAGVMALEDFEAGLTDSISSSHQDSLRVANRSLKMAIALKKDEESSE